MELTAFQSSFDPPGMLWATTSATSPMSLISPPTVPPAGVHRSIRPISLPFWLPCKTRRQGRASSPPRLVAPAGCPPRPRPALTPCSAPPVARSPLSPRTVTLRTGRIPLPIRSGTCFQASNSSGIAAAYAATLAAAKSHAAWACGINETNTFYNGGLAGVSNAFASALWVADVLGSYAQAGILGVNFHGGSSGPYTPFTMTAGSAGYTVVAQPVYYGMMFFAQFIQNGAAVIAATPSGAVPGTASVYASRDGSGALRVLLINKSLTGAVATTVASSPIWPENISPREPWSCCRHRPSRPPAG